MVLETELLSKCRRKTRLFHWLTMCSIVAIHGMGAHPDDTWTKHTMVNDASGDGTEDKNTRKRNTRNKNAKNKNTGHEITIDNVGGRWVNWLQKEDMLPAIVPNARIMRFGYKSKWMGDESEGPTRTSVRTISPRLLDALKRKRKVSKWHVHKATEC